MKTFKITLGPGVEIGIHDLLDDNLLVIAMRRSGKTMRLRSIAEQVGKHMPIYVFDHEGEFASLREELPILICGENGEVPARPETAGALARRLVEMHASAVLDISTLTRKNKRLFVMAFLQAMIDLPKKLWGPRLIVLDEIHEFCPQGGKDIDAQARETVNQLMALGGKRGLGVVAGTQRIAKLDKDSAAEFGNVCVGRTTLGADIAKACERLGFTREQGAALKNLKKGEMYAAGTSFDFDEAKLFQGILAKTTHPASAGQRRALKPPPPNKAILKYADELKDLQRVADVEKATQKSLAEENARLRAEVEQLRARKPAPTPAPTLPNGRDRTPPPAPKIDTSAYVLQGREDVCRMMNDDFARISEKVTDAKQKIFAVEAAVNEAIRLLHKTRPKSGQLAKATATIAKQTPPPNPKANGRATGLGGGWSAALEKQPADGRGARRATSSNGSSEVSGGPKRILTVLAQHSDGLDPSSLRMFAQIGTKSSMRTYVGILLARKHIERDGGKIRITDAGLQALGPYNALPQGRALVDYWLDWVGTGGPRRILEAAIEAGDEGIDKSDLLEVAAIGTPSSLRTYVGTLQAARLIEAFREDGKSRIRAVASLLKAASA